MGRAGVSIHASRLQLESHRWAGAGKRDRASPPSHLALAIEVENRPLATPGAKPTSHWWALLWATLVVVVIAGTLGLLFYMVLTLRS